MIALYVLTYLLIGVLLVSISLRVSKSEGDTSFLGFVTILWPVATVFFVVGLLMEALGALAKKAGGIK